MVTYGHGASSILVLGGLFAVACGTLAPIGSDPSHAAAQDPDASIPATATVPGAYIPGSTTPEAKYPGHGFIVHEWGTNTIVVGSDGSVQRGLHHEEEDLPAFVYDRIKAGGVTGSVEVKMETPVLYFYSDAALDAEVQVSFPAGVMTQWYPSARGFTPMLADIAGSVVDPVMDPKFSPKLDACIQRFSDGKAIENGQLDWGTVHIGARTDRLTAPDAPLAQYTWSHARAVDANPLRVQKPGAAVDHEEERFLFYRGLGNFALPARITSGGPGSYEGSGVSILDRDGANPLGSTFVLDVGATSAKFAVHPEGLAASHGALIESLSGATSMPLDAYADALAAAMTAELDKTGLYHDEAVGMVSTWRRQWFRTPGLRVLYFAPQAWTDTQIPLAITPKPDRITRVMVIRTEVITTELEWVDVAAVRGINAGDATATAHFDGLGRFAEPRLRRARQLVGDAGPSAAATLLAKISGANTTLGTGE